MMAKRQRGVDKVLDALCDTAREEGEQYFRKDVQNWVIYAHREANKRYQDPEWHPQYHAFLQGFIEARRRYDARQMELKGEVT